MTMTSINFKANFLKTTNVFQKTSDNKYKNVEVSIIEFNPRNPNDRNALAKTASDWEQIAPGYANTIYIEALTHSPTYDEPDRFLGVTKQKEDFENPDPDKILELSLYIKPENDNDEILLLQVNPKTNSESEKREFLGVGRSLVNYMKHLSKETEKSLEVMSNNDAVGFYKQLGFVPKNKTDETMLIYPFDKMK